MLARTVKESWIQSQLRLREKEYVDFSQTKIFCGTWNVGGEMPPDSLEDWLCKSGEFDIFALSFQELDLTAGALLGNTSRSIPWEQLIYQTLNNSFNTPYRLLMSKQLVGMLLCIFVKENMLANISDIKSSSTGVGLMGMMGNKGGVAIRFTYFDTSICFVNSHLSAHKEYELRRNQDYRDICRRIFAEEFISIFEHECLLWMGDLNYRFDNLTDFEVKYKIMKEAWSDLLDNDQLYINQRKGLVFEEFLEAPLQFAPTFKYDPNSNTYDTSEKRRVPAWCDRVLWRGSSLENKGYNRCEIMTSDHRPVFSLFDCQIKKINMEKRSTIQHEITKLSDKKENDFLPNCSVSTNHLLFTPVRFSVPINQSFSLNNIGQVPAQFNFIPKTNQKNYCKEWLRVVPSCGIILPGEVIEINVSILVTSISAPSLHSNRDTLDDFIVLHLEGGKDHYVTIKGEYLNSCFGNYIEELVLHPLAVRLNKPINLSASSDNNKRVLSIPKELWHLVNYLFLHALDYEDLFQQSGNQAEIEEIQELLDTAAFFKDYHGSIDSVAESLIRFLDCLAEPVVHYHLYEQCVLPFSSFQQSKQIISSLKTVNYNVFYYLISFLREVLEHSNNNKLTAEKLANLFASVLIKPLPKDAPFETAAKKSAKADFIFQFLTPNFV